MLCICLDLCVLFAMLEVFFKALGVVASFHSQSIISNQAEVFLYFFSTFFFNRIAFIFRRRFNEMDKIMRNS